MCLWDLGKKSRIHAASANKQVSKLWTHVKGTHLLLLFPVPHAYLYLTGMPVSGWLTHIYTHAHTRSFTGRAIVLFLSKQSHVHHRNIFRHHNTCTIKQENTIETVRKDTVREFLYLSHTHSLSTDGTHSLSVLRGIFLGMVLRPSPWQSTVVPLQVHRAGQALALPTSRVQNITTHIHSGPASLPMPAPKQLPLMGIFTTTAASSSSKNPLLLSLSTFVSLLLCKNQESCYTSQVLRVSLYLWWI